MRKYIVLFLLLAAGLSSEVFGQKVWEGKSYQRTVKKFSPSDFDDWFPLLPKRDTVIIRGEEIEVVYILLIGIWNLMKNRSRLRISVVVNKKITPEHFLYAFGRVLSI